MFDRVILINLDRRPDRLERVKPELDSIFPNWIRFSAVDASKLPEPPGWTAGPGAWGCMQSHRHVLEMSILYGWESVLVLEDDVFFVEGFTEKLRAFMAEVPGDWEQLMIGGQFVNRDGAESKEQISPLVLKVSGVERTHCYAVRGQYMRDLYAKWCASNGHCDHVMGPFQVGRKVYAPTEFIAGQTGGKSDISPSEGCASLWVEPPKDWPVTLFVGTPEKAKAYREEYRKHSGHNLKDEVDVGLLDILKKPEGDRNRLLREWVKMIEWEGRSKTPERQAMIYGIPEQLCREAIGERLVVVKKCGACKSVVNAAKAAGRVIGAIVTGKPVLVTPVEQAARLKVCVGCDQFEIATGKRPARCADCGCFVKAKATLATESCPRGKWGAAPKVFWHVAAMPGSWKIIESQAAMLSEVGLLNVDVTFLGSALNLRRFEEVCQESGLKARILSIDANFHHYETLAMLAIERWAKIGSGPVMYLHTKGASVPRHEGKQRWRDLMEREVVRNWRENIAQLDRYNLIGCNWRKFGSHPHFCGNFWITTADYIRTLPPFAAWHGSNRLERFSCESWIGQGSGKAILSLAHKDVDYCSKQYFG